MKTERRREPQSLLSQGGVADRWWEYWQGVSIMEVEDRYRDRLEQLLVSRLLKKNTQLFMKTKKKKRHRKQTALA